MRKVRHAAANIADIVPDVGFLARLGETGEECIVILHQGAYYAVGSLCPHQNAPLQGAPAEKGRLICKRHGYAFDLKSGDCTTVGGYGIPVYTVDLEADVIYVSVWDFD